MERNFDREQGCPRCGNIVDARNGYLVKHNAADGTQCPGSRTVGAVLTPQDRDRDI